MFRFAVMDAARATKEQRELVRILYLEHGHQKASELSGVRYDLVRQWASRYNWDVQRNQALSQTVTVRVAERITDELAQNEKQTRLSLSRYAARAAKDAEQASLKDSPFVHKAAQVAGIAHKWGDNDKANTHFTLNVLNINSLQIDDEQG